MVVVGVVSSVRLSCEVSGVVVSVCVGGGRKVCILKVRVRSLYTR